MSRLDNQPAPEKGKVARTPVWLVVVGGLLAVAVLGAAYLAWVSIKQGPVAGCGPESGCNKVLQSRWAYWVGIPVSIPALLVYLAFLGATVLLARGRSADEERGAWAALSVLSLTVAGAALWFVGLQVFEIKAFCKFCMTAHTCGFLASVLCLSKMPLVNDPGLSMWSGGSEKRGVPRGALPVLAVASLAMVAVLLAGQVFIQKKRNVVKVLAASSTNQPVQVSAPVVASTNRVGSSQGAQTPPPRMLSPRAQLIGPRLLSLYDGSFKIKLDEVPMIGSPDAPVVLVSVFDYTCHHCRELHPLLVEAQRRFSNQLGIVSLVLPLATNCNPLFPRAARSSTNACDYARLGLAVWRAKREAFPQFDDWLFASAQPAPVSVASNYAVQLVGEQNLARALADDWIGHHIRDNALIHATNWVASGTAQLPQVVMGQVISSGPLNNLGELIGMLRTYLGLREK